jgi:hypothetical protein
MIAPEFGGKNTEFGTRNTGDRMEKNWVSRRNTEYRRQETEWKWKNC